MPLHVLSTILLIIRRSKLYYTASGIITPVGCRPVHGTATYRCDKITRTSMPKYRSMKVFL